MFPSYLILLKVLREKYLQSDLNSKIEKLDINFKRKQSKCRKRKKRSSKRSKKYLKRRRREEDESWETEGASTESVLALSFREEALDGTRTRRRAKQWGSVVGFNFNFGDLKECVQRKEVEREYIISEFGAWESEMNQWEWKCQTENNHIFIPFSFLFLFFVF